MCVVSLPRIMYYLNYPLSWILLLADFGGSSLPKRSIVKPNRRPTAAIPSLISEEGNRVVPFWWECEHILRWRHYIESQKESS